MSPAEAFRQTFGHTAGEMVARMVEVAVAVAEPDRPIFPILQQGMSPAEAFRQTFEGFLKFCVHTISGGLHFASISDPGNEWLTRRLDAEETPEILLQWAQEF